MARGGKIPGAGRKKVVGRPTGYKPENAGQVERLCALGATDDEIASFFGIHRATVYRWKLDYPEFCDAIKSGKVHADERVERSLYQKATGYSYTEQEAIKVKVGQYEEKVEVVEVVKHAPTDTTAAIFWLKNRRSDAWRDKSEVVHKREASELADGDLEDIARTGRDGTPAAARNPEKLN